MIATPTQNEDGQQDWFRLVELFLMAVPKMTPRAQDAVAAYFEYASQPVITSVDSSESIKERLL